MAKYIGVSIGPIIKTLSQSKSTAELWGSSYIFSYFMRELVAIISDSSDGEVLFLDHSLKFDKDGEEVSSFLFARSITVGLFHDRCIFKILDDCKELNLFEKMNDFKFEIINKLSIDLVNEKDNQELLQKYLQKYLQVKSIKMEFEEDEIEKIVDIMSSRLDAIELNKEYLESEKTNYLLKALSNENIKQSNLWKTIFRKDENLSAEKCLNSGRIPSTEEIARHSSVDINYQYQNYFAIVQSDADNMGELVKNANIEEIELISRKNMKHAYRASQLIDGFGGFVYYAGGDDLLFMAPVINSSGESIFKLIDTIKESFNLIFKDEKQRFIDKVTPKLNCENKQFSLSFGIAINNKKHPLSESLEMARNLLFSDAKNFKSLDIEKNAIALSLTKHSGKTIKTVVGNNSSAYLEFKALLESIFTESKSKNKTDDFFIKSVIYKLKTQDYLIFDIMEKEDSKLRLANYFKNSFNEEIHISNSAYLNGIQRLIFEIYSNQKSGEDRNKNFMIELEFYLKICAFLLLPESKRGR